MKELPKFSELMGLKPEDLLALPYDALLQIARESPGAAAMLAVELRSMIPRASVKKRRVRYGINNYPL